MIWGTSGVSEDYFGAVWAGKRTKKANFLECVDTYTVDQVINSNKKCVLNECGSHEGNQKKGTFNQKLTFKIAGNICHY